MLNKEVPHRSADSLLAQAGCTVDGATGDIVQPIHLATTYERDADGGYARGYVYGRLGNPNRYELEHILCTLEGASSGYTFSSGMTAVASILQALNPGSTVVFPNDVFHGVRKLVDTLPGLSISPRYVDYSDDSAFSDILAGGPDMVWIESPSNPMMRITDIRAISHAAHAAGATVVVDGTWTTPLLQKPIELGADVVFHSLTKYFSGHADTLGGAVLFATDSDFSLVIGKLQQLSGSGLDPFSCWLTLRGMRTLALRIERHCDNAEAVVSYLKKHARVREVFFPGESEADTSIVNEQMRRRGAMISFTVGMNADEAHAVVSRLRLIKRATSLGSTESLIEHRASMEGDGSATPDNLLRLSVGLEHVDEIVGDLEYALG